MDYRANQVTVGNILKKAFEIFRDNFAILLAISIIATLIGAADNILNLRLPILSAIFAIALGLVIIPTFNSMYQLEIYDAMKEDRKITLKGVFDHYSPDILRISVKKTLRIIGWTLLFVIPGIYFTYAYDRVVYIRAENPDLTDSQCFEKSKREMENYKFTLFISLLAVGIITTIIITPFVMSLFNNPRTYEILSNIREISADNPAFSLSTRDYYRIMLETSTFGTILLMLITITLSAYNITISPVFQRLRSEEFDLAKEI